MEKKRSIGVTIFAIIFIIGGVFGMVSGLIYLSGKNMMASQQFTVESQKQFMLKHSPNMSKEDMEKFEKEVTPFLEKMVQAQNEIAHSKTFTIYTPLTAILGVIGFFLGIGLFRLKEIARKGMIYFIILSMPIHLFIMYAATQEMIKTTAKYMPEINEGPVSMLTAANVMLVIQGILMAGFVLFVIYYFNRPKVKEQFENT